MTAFLEPLASLWPGVARDAVPWPLLAAVGIVLLVLGIAAFRGIHRWWTLRGAGYREIPLAFPIGPFPQAKPVEPRPGDEPAATHGRAPSNRSRPVNPRAQPSPQAEPATQPPVTSKGGNLPPEEAGEIYEGRTIRFYRPPAATLQLIPGRLEVITGEDRNEIIRFVRTPGQPPEITLGRSKGAPLRHIQFRAPTVSRQHARMMYASSRWIISNHSRTNPVVVNGIELVPPLDRHVLTDGDEIELGEIIFRFHER